MVVQDVSDRISAKTKKKFNLSGKLKIRYSQQSSEASSKHQIYEDDEPTGLWLNMRTNRVTK